MNGPRVVAIMFLAVASCSRSPSTEERLIGTWEAPASTTLYDARTPNAPFPITSKEMVQIIFTPDHKEVWRYGGDRDDVVAKWHLEGDDLVFVLETQSEAGPPGTTKREKIKKITSEELVFTDGTTDGIWKRAR
jgi:hypothetical protein